MAEQLNKLIDNLKEYWGKLAPKTQKIVLGAAAAVVAFAVGLTVFLNMPKMGYKQIFPGMSGSEAAEVYAVLLEMGVSPEIDSRGNVQVPTDQWDDLQYRLSAQGYPKTTLTYDVFSNMSGFTTTEFEKRVALTYQLQEQIRATLNRWSGIDDAAVIINVPESSNFVWDQSKQEQSSASVTVTMRPGHNLAPEQVSAIKNHVASAVPGLQPAKVTVIDALTGVEPPSLENASGHYSAMRLEFERQVELAIENNVKRLLVPTYGTNGVTAVAKVSLDYDKIITERREVLPQEDDGEGVLTHIDEYYTVGGYDPARGLVGEEYNTDIPEYPNLSGINEGDVTVFDRSMDFDVGYVLTQIEKGEPLLREASLAVIVSDDNFTTEKEALLIDLISKSVNIQPYNITVANMDFQAAQAVGAGPAEEAVWMRYLPWLLGGGLLAIALGLAVLLVLRQNRRRKAEAALAEEVELEEQRKRDLQKEISEHKRMLQEEAKAAANLKEDAITQEVREFAARNPEITANLIRSLMREDR
jgi:flagellar M-ring protein FliF